MNISAINALNVVSKSTNFNRPNARIHNTFLKQDTVTFSSSALQKEINVSPEKAEIVVNSLRTSTSGHRDKYMGENFTPEIVKLITLGVADVAKDEARKNNSRPLVLIGGDTRRATRESLPLIQDTLQKQGVDVLSIKNPVPTPMLAVAAKDKNIDLSVLMTASHNPWEDGGYNFVTKTGAIAPAPVTEKIADYVDQHAKTHKYTESAVKGNAIDFNPFPIYKSLMDNNFIDWDRIRDAKIDIYYDGLKGTGPYVVPELFKSYGIDFERVISSGQTGPNPTGSNLSVLKKAIAASANKIKVGLSNDGDADRFGVIDEKGNFINPNDVMLLVGYHLAKNKGLRGAAIRSQASSRQLDDLADVYGLKKFETPVGFKYIGEDILNLRKNGEDILVAGEESGGLTVAKHIPEKDGIMAISLILDLIAQEGKPLSEILQNIKQKLGVSYSMSDFSKKLYDEAAKDVIMAKVEKKFNDMKNGKIGFGPIHFINVEKSLDTRRNMENYRPGGDGYKFVLTDGSSVLVRKSGTEPLVKCYIDAAGKNQQYAKLVNDLLRSYMSDFFVI